MDNYTHVATCRLAAYVCVYMVPVKCEKYSVKSEILGENSLFIHLLLYYFSLLYICDHTNGQLYTCCNV